MDKHICSIEGCRNKTHSRGWCNTHYGRWHKYGTPYRQCKGCGAELPMEFGQRQYCSDDCKPRCKAEGCDRPKRSQDGYCARHKALVRKWGKPVGHHEWRATADSYTCQACGTEFKAGTGCGRQFCSGKCQRIYSVHKGDIPSIDFDCTICGRTIHRDRWSGMHIRCDKKMCDTCKRAIRGTRHGVSPAYLAERDGYLCGICEKPVDINLRHPDLMSPSVDHIVPVSLGGTHDEENLQLAHLTCNVRKQARLDYKPAQ